MSRMIIVCGLSLLFVTAGVAADSAFKVGFAKRDITPQRATPMWGYGARHAMLSEGTADPLQAKAVVIEAGNERLAIVGMDLGRGPRAGNADAADYCGWWLVSPATPGHIETSQKLIHA